MANNNPATPNVVFVLTDDQGYWAMGCAGNPEIRTPNLDALAATGVRFENFFCTSPVCSPARASLLTGRIPSQHGIMDWIRNGNDEESSEKQRIEYLAGQPGYTDILAEHGYVCGISGKWHMGDSLTPQKSFSHWFVHPRGGGTYINSPMIRDGHFVETEGYLTDVITEDAIDFLRQQVGSDQPFYLNVCYTAPHSPWIDQHPQDIVESYDDCPFLSCPQEPQHSGADFYDLQYSKLAAKREDESIPVREYLKGYFASVTAMDAGVGRIIAALDSLGLRENTLVVFMSDNGFNCGHHGIWGKGNVTAPLNMYDTSIKVPAIMNHPGRLPSGVVCDALVSGYDFMPTLLDYVRLENPYADNLPGRSFMPLMAETGAHNQHFVVVYDEYGSTRMIRTREWKYVHRYPYGPHELYDLVHDPGERINLLADQRIFSFSEEMVRDKVTSLKADLEDWFFLYVDPARDGVREPVTGRGQLGLVGPAAKGQPAFHHRESASEIYRTKGHIR
jgi:arylsulfatase A-like enzyme